MANVAVLNGGFLIFAIRGDFLRLLVMSISELIVISLLVIELAIESGHLKLQLIISSEQFINLPLKLDIFCVLHIKLTDQSLILLERNVVLSFKVLGLC